MTARVIPLQGSSRYVIERELGQGGMGVVYEARDLERNTRVALKALHNTDAANIYRLKHEFRQLADLSHPNLVSLHELCFDGDKWFFTMELVDGETFDDYVAAPSTRPLTPSRSSLATIAGRHHIVRDASVTLSQRAIGGDFPLPRVTCDVERLRSALRQLVEAIAALHEAGKLHRDIKPSNVLVTSVGRVVVLDFGLVSNSTYVDPEAHDAERSVGGVVFGTPAYMSPEQAAGEPVTTASDWYSIGAMLYEALTGQLPFDGTVLQILKQKDELEPVPAVDIVSGVPDDLDQLCRSLLHRDPKRRPTAPEILRYLSGISSHHPPAYDASSIATSARRSGELFVGRKLHLATLRAGFERAREGEAATIFVHGYSGMGKSALVRCFANELIKNDEAVVLRGRCYERESVPYKAFDDVIDALSRYLMRLPSDKAAELLPRNIHALTRLFPVLRRVKAVAQAHIPVHQSNDPLEIRGQAFSALKDLLLRLSDWHPLVINIDDLQWGDMDSARLLSHILGPPDAPPVLFVGAYRREERYTSAFLRHVLGDETHASGASTAEQLAVDALAPDEAEHLTRELLRELPLATAMFTRTIAADSEGVPFFIGELAQHVKGQKQALPATLDSVSLDNVIMTRIASMSPDAQRVLEVLSVAARPLEQGMLLEAAGLPTGDRAALLALRAARLIRTRGTRQSDVAETYHDRVRETVAAQLSAQRAREIHACIARASEAWGVGEPEQLVVHYSEAGEGMRAGETAIHAAHAAAEKFAFNRAAELYRKAIELLDDSDVVRKLDLSRHMASALANAGYGARAAEVYLRVSESAPKDERRSLRLQAAQQLLRSGRFEPGLALAKQLLSEVKLSYPESSAVALASYLGHTAFLSLRGFEPRRKPARRTSVLEQERLRTLGALFQEVGGHDVLRGALLQVQLLRHALAAGDPDSMLQGLAWACCFLSVQGGSGNLRRAEEALASVDELARELNTPYADATRKMAITSSFVFGKARFRDALEPALEAEQLLRTRCVGASWEANWVAQLRYTALEFAGDLSALLHETPGRERESAERSDQYSLGLLIQSVPLAHLMRDSPQQALDFLSAQAPKLGPGFSTFHFTMLVRTVDTLLYQGEGRAALDQVNAQWSALTGTLLYRGRMTRASSHLLRARAALMAYRQDPRPELLQLALQDARVLGKLRAGFLGFESAILAQIAQTKGDRQAAIGHYRQAITDFRSEQADRSALYAQLRLGELLDDDAGRQSADATRAELHAQGIQHVERWVTMQMPLSPRV